MGKKISTKLIRSGLLKTQFMETSESLFLTSGFIYKTAEEAEEDFKDEKRRFMYSRFGNPTVEILQKKLVSGSLLDVKVNNDSPNRQNAGSVAINTMEINTKLLVADGDIVVIGGIKKNTVGDSKSGIPGVSNVPVIGKMFSGTSKSDTLNELLVFIAPRIL